MSQQIHLKSNSSSQPSNLIQLIGSYYELTKPRITYLVVFSMAVGYLMGAGNGIDWVVLLNAAIGTFMIAGGTAAQNQVIERNHDKLMKRTASRPLPTRRVEKNKAMIFSFTMIVAGFVYMLMTVNFVAALVSGLTTLLYLGAYTPLKRVSFSNVLIGAVPGALPPVGGWAAATADILHPLPWLLFGVVFLWQVPHVLAIAWLCKDDYSNAGFHMLPKNDQSFRLTASLIFSCLVLLLPTTYGIFYFGHYSFLFLTGGLVSAIYYAYYGWRFYMAKDNSTAKKLMFASFGYLPIVWIFLLVEVVLIG
jgi:protoheme IX farnesyltransferase